jgi:hypothetical protein
MAESPSSQHTGFSDHEIPQQLYTRAPRRPQEDVHYYAPPKSELKAIRRAGKIAYQHLYRTVEETLRQATPQPEASPIEASATAPPQPSTQRQGDSRSSLPTTATYFTTTTTSREKRPRRAATGQRSLNVVQLSAGSIRPQSTIHTDPSTSEREDTSMSDDPPSTC